MFDESGNMGRPWAEAGYTVHCYDILNDGRVERFASGGAIHFHQADLTNAVVLASIVMLGPCVVFGFPPCTDLAVSGAAHFAAKRLKDPLFQDKAVALARAVETVGNAAHCPWFAENPVSVLASMWRQPDHRFNPFEYGGYLPEDDVHPRWPQYIKPRDAYPKKTCLWSGGGFTMPPKKPVAVDAGYSAQHSKLGGKSAKTKQIRSETPRGFAIAVFKHLGEHL